MEVEYICETKLDKEWQKQLNQWKHMYEIEVLGFSYASPACYVSMVIKRTRKAPEPFDHTATNSRA